MSAVAAFYTPLKHPDEREPSGDRQIARALVTGLEGCGFAPELASRLTVWRRQFDAAEAERVERRAALVGHLLVRRYRRRPPATRPRLWVTYQNYHRCPDFVGPAVATALDVPYVLVDTAVSTKSRRTPFRPWASAARLAVRRADLIFAMSPRDLPRLRAIRGPRFAATRLRLLPPAVDPAVFAGNHGARTRHQAALTRRLAATEGPILLCVAMMRQADKLDSYRLLAAALGRIRAPWRLAVVGDGPARGAVETAFASLPAERIAWLGAMAPDELPPLYLGADLFAFPGLGEALGLVYLEAAAAGLPVVACAGPGPQAMVAPDGGLLTAPTPTAFADGLAALLTDPARRAAMGAAARRFVATERNVAGFARALGDGLALLQLP
ncbi:MAG TPA: glycosyltransferase family 4 protein [Methylomirabilota bacterium]|nr:glycosyltransferase family 4 protein [Methylomirabilota bacterium]